MPEYFMGLDLGQAQDYTALAIAEEQAEQGKEGAEVSYHLRHLERLPLGTPYPDVVTHVRRLITGTPLEGHCTLILDLTGVGAPVYDMFAAADLPCELYGVSITGGDTVTWDWRRVRVPKRDLVSATQVLLQSGRLKIAQALPEAATLIQELLNFRVKIDPLTAHDSYSAWRETAHDDLVLATALAVWIAENRPPAMEVW